MTSSGAAATPLPLESWDISMFVTMGQASAFVLSAVYVHKFQPHTITCIGLTFTLITALGNLDDVYSYRR